MSEQKKITKLYKYREFNDNAKSIITNSALWYANPKNFNDPFDMQLSFKQYYSKEEIKSYIKNYAKNSDDVKKLPKHERKKIIQRYSNFSNDINMFVKFQNELHEKTLSKCGVVSLSSRWDSILMWSHYSHNHEGLVFEFDYSKRRVLLDEFPFKVDYVDQYDLLSYCENFNIRKKQMEKILLTKFLDWRYEHEYRIINFDSQGAKKFTKELLTSIIFGLNASQGDINDMISLCKNNGFEHVKFKKIKKTVGSFSLKLIDIKY